MCVADSGFSMLGLFWLFLFFTTSLIPHCAPDANTGKEIATDRKKISNNNLVSVFLPTALMMFYKQI